MDVLTNQNKSWTTDSLIVTQNNGQKLPDGAVLATGMNINGGSGSQNIELILKNGDCVFNATTSLYIEIMSLQFSRLSASGISSKVM